MLNYATVGTNDTTKAKAFYDQLMELAGMKPMMDHPSGGRLYIGPNGQLFGVLGPHNGKPATVGNGSMFGFAMPTRKKVDEFHALALKLGGTCEGAPGLRGDPGMNLYFAYVRDLDGNKLCAFRIGPEN
jgi:catechol 2,3-dioxygenase-like lactoylglutathione lyase family enzyme